MTQALREPTLQTLGLGTVIDIFRNARLPANPGDLVDEVFGEGPKRGSLVRYTEWPKPGTRSPRLPSPTSTRAK